MGRTPRDLLLPSSSGLQEHQPLPGPLVPAQGSTEGDMAEPAAPAGKTGLRKAKRDGTGAVGRRGAGNRGPKPSLASASAPVSCLG